VDCIDVAEDRDKWQILVNKVMNDLLGSLKCKEFPVWLRN